MSFRESYDSFVRNRIKAPKWAANFNDCAKLVNTTVSPYVFFPRFDEMVRMLELLKDVNSLTMFRCTHPRIVLKQVLQNKEVIVKAFLDRSMADERQKVARKKYADVRQLVLDEYAGEMESFFGKMSAENVSYFREQYEAMAREVIAAGAQEQAD